MIKHFYSLLRKNYDSVTITPRCIYRGAHTAYVRKKNILSIGHTHCKWHATINLRECLKIFSFFLIRSAVWCSAVCCLQCAVRMQCDQSHWRLTYFCCGSLCYYCISWLSAYSSRWINHSGRNKRTSFIPPFLWLLWRKDSFLCDGSNKCIFAFFLLLLLVRRTRQ